MEVKNSSIHNAALNGDFGAVEKLLHESPELANTVDGDSRTPLHWACVSGSIEIFKLLLSLPDTVGPVPDASLLQDLDKEDGFGSYHIDINQQDEGGWTPLMIAISAGYEPIYLTLLAIPSTDIALRNRGGQSILHFAASKSRIPAVKHILSTAEGRKLLRIKDLQGQLPLHRAAASGSLPITTLLLEAGSPLSAHDVGSWTALHHACSEGHGDVAVRLIQEGIDTDKLDRDGESALKLCPRDGKCETYIRMNFPDGI